MSRNQFRSQPTLQRTGGGGGFAPLVLGFAALAGAGALGAFGLSHLNERTPSPPVEAQAAPEGDMEMALAGGPAPEPDATSPIEPVAQVAAPALAAAEPASKPAQHDKRPAKRRSAAVPQYPLASSADDAAVQAAARERQQRDYEAAVARYAQSEHAEGYRWAKQNQVHVARYCRAAAKRTEAFMQGCLAFVARKPEQRDEGPAPGEG